MKRLAIFFPQAMPHAFFPPCRVHKPKQSNSFHGKYLWTGTWVSELWSLSEKKIGIWFSLNTEANTREIKYTNKREERVGFSWYAFACKFTSSSHSSTWLYMIEPKMTSSVNAKFDNTRTLGECNFYWKTIIMAIK